MQRLRNILFLCHPRESGDPARHVHGAVFPETLDTSVRWYDKNNG